MVRSLQFAAVACSWCWKAWPKTKTTGSTILLVCTHLRESWMPLFGVAPSCVQFRFVPNLLGRFNNRDAWTRSAHRCQMWRIPLRFSHWACSSSTSPAKNIYKLKQQPREPQKLRAHAVSYRVLGFPSACCRRWIRNAPRKARDVWCPQSAVKQNENTPKSQRRFSGRVRLFPGGVYSAGMTNSPGTSLPPEGTEEAGGGGLGLRGRALIGRPHSADLTRSLPHSNAGAARRRGTAQRTAQTRYPRFPFSNLLWSSWFIAGSNKKTLSVFFTCVDSFIRGKFLSFLTY